MTDNSIVIENVGKRYKMYPSRNARLKEWIVPFSKSQHKDKWVLQDINLTVAAGEAVGIIGMNGAGKSTLLKIVTGTTVPTTGNVKFHGTVAALLELGLGFHPDFTGRQNVYMSGQLLGYTNEEITECMQQVEDFAEIGDAIDAPVRTYSSGMSVRLAFSVATIKRPDILIVDEALSVGDAYFQHKSFNRINEFRKAGTTLLFVSHDKGAIQAVCDRAILLDHGKMIKVGRPEKIMDYYNATLSMNDIKIRQENLLDGRTRTVSGNGYAKVKKIYFVDEASNHIENIGIGDKVNLHIFVKVNKNIPKLVCGFTIKDNLGQDVYGTNTAYLNSQLSEIKKGDIYEFVYSFNLNIGPGNYSVSTALHGEATHNENNYEWRDLALVFEAINEKCNFFVGSAFLDANININKVRQL